ncbi:MAG TPA: flagellar biosynthesis anti-sigma factor FlgM [Chromatiaceae bacterium]|nr:flagellar biosynthesis anti-sigma factor FlgM [Chromatiaceae bacterium]
MAGSTPEPISGDREMPIDINGLSNIQNQVSGDRNSLPTSDRQPVGDSGENGRSSVQDTVSFSETAVKLGQLGVAVDDTPVVDTQKVERIKQTLMDGTYNVDPTKIAEKLVDLDLALGKPGN